LVLNDTFAVYWANAFYFISVKDEYNRNATGIRILVNMVASNGQTGSRTITTNATASDYMLLFNEVIPFNQTAFNTGGISYTFTITVASNMTSFIDPYTETFVVYGPDTVAPALQGDPAIQNPTNLKFPQAFNITARIDTSQSALDNIGAVVLYYRLSTNTAIDEGNAIYPGTFNSTLMSQTAILEVFYATINFVDNGTWIEFYVEVADRAGYGLIGPYPADTNFPTGYGWDTSFTLNYTSPIGSAVMGDVVMLNDNDFELVDSVEVNLLPLTDNTNVDPGENVTIDLYIDPDNVGYKNVTISFQILSFDAQGILINNGSFTTIELNIPTITTLFNGESKYRIQYILNGENLTYFEVVNYFYIIFDQAGNRYKTDHVFKAVEGTPANNTEVTDEDLPEDPNPTRTMDYETENRNNTVTTKQVLSFNETATISYNITDSGIGIANITLSIFYYDNTTALFSTETAMLVMNGVILFPDGFIIDAPSFLFLLYLSQLTNNGTFTNVTENNGFYFLQFNIDFSNLPENSTVSWKIDAIDVAGNPIEVNPQGVGDDPIKFIILDPPEEITNPLVTTSTIVTTNSLGETIIILSTIGLNLTDTADEDSGNALLVILTFSLLVFAITLYYQRHNIREYFEKSARKRKARSTLSELIDEIKRLGAEERYKSAIILVWEALERLSKEILQVPRSYNQTAREFTSYLSTVTIVDRETLLTISNAFEAAKYGRDEPTYDDWDDAVKALDITVSTIIESGARVQIDEDDDDF
jgi:hypothetical protein